jgi:branched-chain amino acid transport system substrate-binding protein
MTRKFEITRRAALGGAGALLAAPMLSLRAARAEAMPGVTATEIKIGNTQAYSGPASQYGNIGKAETAFFKALNEKGGIGGRKINFITLDDGYTPSRTVEQTRRLVEQDGVSFMFNSLGTPTNSAVHRYLNQKKVPQLFVSTGADKWADPKHFPWTMGWQPSYRTEAQIYTKYLLKNKPGAKLAILYQNDDFGKDYVNGVRDVLKGDFDKIVTKATTYEVTDPTIDSQIVALQGTKADALLVAAVPKFAAQSIRKVYDIGWKPLFFLTNVSISVGAVMQPAGMEKGVGIISGAFQKDPTDPRFKDDSGMNEWRAFMAKEMPGAELSDLNYVQGYGTALTLMQVLKQCGDDLSRANIMKQAANLKNLEIPTLLPGIKINTSPTNFHPIAQMQLVKWDGKTWELFGDVLEGA